MKIPAFISSIVPKKYVGCLFISQGTPKELLIIQFRMVCWKVIDMQLGMFRYRVYQTKHKSIRKHRTVIARIGTEFF